jgi:two-component system chemotaxis response regulator CheB
MQRAREPAAVGPPPPARRVRVLVVDDSVVVRRLVSRALGEDPSLEVVGAAANGRIALAMVEDLAPDVITLDVEMPEMDGIETLAGLRRVNRSLPVIMYSVLTARGASVTIDALMAGANDYAIKPAGTGSLEASMLHVKEELVPRIKALAHVPAQAATAARGQAPVAAHVGPSHAASHHVRDHIRAPLRARVEILVIATSTGGPNALTALLGALPAGFAVPIAIVQHMPPLFTRSLAERLSATTKLRVHEAAGGEELTPGSAWIAPADRHLVVRRSGERALTALSDDPPESFCRPAADVLFRSAASAFGAGVLAVVLTGMGQDGLRGSDAVHRAGGRVLAQDEASSVVWGMPGAVSAAGLCDDVLPLDDLAVAIIARVESGRGRVT